MNFFKNNKPKIKSESIQSGVKFNIGYFKLNNPENYKSKLLRSIIGSGLCLIIINTKYMYKDQNKDYITDLSELISEFDKADIKYKKIAVKRTQDVSIFGISVKQSDAKKYEDYIIGFIVESDNFENFIFKLSSYNLQYYIDCNGTSADELLIRFESNFDDEEKLRSEFKYSIFDDNFIKQAAIFARMEDSESINGMLEEINKDL
jgi:hypothetical protein